MLCGPGRSVEGEVGEAEFDIAGGIESGVQCVGEIIGQ